MRARARDTYALRDGERQRNFIMPRSISATEREREVREVGRSSHTHVELNVTGEVGGRRSSHPDRVSSERERWRETGRQAGRQRHREGGGAREKAQRERKRVRKRNRGHKCIIQ